MKETASGSRSLEVWNRLPKVRQGQHPTSPEADPERKKKNSGKYKKLLIQKPLWSPS